MKRRSFLLQVRACSSPNRVRDLPDIVSSSPMSDDFDIEIIPFGLASVQELLRVLISLLNPHDQQHTDSMRLMALGLLNIAFEVGGRSMGEFPSLRMMVADHLCKHLFQVCGFFVAATSQTVWLILLVPAGSVGSSSTPLLLPSRHHEHL